MFFVQWKLHRWMTVYHSLWYGISFRQSSSSALLLPGKRVVKELIIPDGLASNSVSVTTLSAAEKNKQSDYKKRTLYILWVLISFFRWCLAEKGRKKKRNESRTGVNLHIPLLCSTQVQIIPLKTWNQLIVDVMVIVDSPNITYRQDAVLGNYHYH